MGASDLALGQALQIRLVDREPSIFLSDVNFDDVRLMATAIPEPAAWAMLLLGLLPLVGLRAFSAQS